MTSFDQLKLEINKDIQYLHTVELSYACINKIIEQSKTCFESILSKNYSHNQDNQEKTIKGQENSYNIMALLSESINEIDKKRAIFEVDAIETLEGYISNYEENCKNFINQGEEIYNEITDFKVKVNNSKKIYNQYSLEKVKRETLIQYLKNEVQNNNLSIKDFDEENNKFIDIKIESERAESDYNFLLGKFNQFSGEKTQSFFQIIADLQQYKESKSIFLYSSYGKLIKLFNSIQENINICSSYIENLIKNFNVNKEKNQENTQFDMILNSDIFHKLEFIPFNVKNYSSFQKTDFSNINPSSFLFPCNNSFEITNLKNLKNSNLILIDRDTINYSLSKLLKGEKVKNCNEIKNILNQSYCKELINFFLEEIDQPIIIDSEDTFKELHQIFYEHLTQLSTEINKNISYIYNILIFSKYVTFKNEKGARLCLYYILKKHEIWQNKMLWKNMIETILNFRLKEYKYYYQKSVSFKDQKVNIPEMNRKRNIYNAIKGFWTYFRKTENKNEESYESGLRNTVFDVLYFFCFFLSAYKITQEISFNLIHFFGTENNLADPKIGELFIYYYSLQPFDINITLKNKIKISIPQISKNSLKPLLKEDITVQIVIVLKKSIKFINDLKLLRNLLLLSKSIKEDLINEIFIQILIRLNLEIPLKFKTHIWEQIIKIETFDVNNFEQLIRLSEQNNEQLKNINDVIDIDVKRSFNNISKINPEVLKKILKSYAYYNQNIEYCQGMNFLAGFFYFIFQDERKTFRILSLLMDRYELKTIYSENMPMLRVCFYIIDRLVALYLPDLNSHFIQENINSSLYSSAWILTMFCSSLQYSINGSIPKLLESFWDIFLLYKWKGLFKMCIYLLYIQREAIDGQKFENSMMNLGDILKGEVFKSEEIAKNLKKKIHSWKITNSSLKKYEEEYNRILNEPKVIKKIEEEEKYNRLLTKSMI